MKYRVVHDCDGYRIQKSIFGFIWFDAADTYFYSTFNDRVDEYTTPYKHVYAEKDVAMDIARRLKFRLRYKGHTIRSDKNYYVDLKSYEFFRGYSIWSNSLSDVKKQIDREVERKNKKKNVEIFPV